MATGSQLYSTRFAIPFVSSELEYSSPIEKDRNENQSLYLDKRLILTHTNSISLLAKIPLMLSEDQGYFNQVAKLINLIVELHLPGCYKIVLHQDGDTSDSSNRYGDLVKDLTSKGNGDFVIWELMEFLSSTPPDDQFIFRYSHLKTNDVFCILFVVFADLKVVGEAFNKVQRGSWLKGATKYMLVFPGNIVTTELLTAHPVIGQSYNLVVMSEASKEGNVSLNWESPKLDFVFFQTCPYCNDGNPLVNYIAHWKSEKGFLFSEPFYPDLFQTFNGHLFRAVTLVYEPFSCYHKVSDDILIPTGKCVDNTMLHEMSLSLNFTYKFTEPKDGQWGHKLDNGSYTGVIGSVERMEADFSLNIAITQDREEVVDCTIGYHIEPITFATTKPRLLNQAFALIRPFRVEVWIVFGLTVLIAGPVYYIISKYATLYRPALRPPNLAKSSFMAFATCFNQSIKWLPIGSTRIFIGIYIFSMYVTVTMYIAMLTASLTLPTLSPTLNTLEKLVESDFSWGIQDLGAADYQLLKSSKVPLYQRVFQGLKQCPSLDECIIRARDTKYAFITWRTYLEDRIAVRFTSSAGERQLHIAIGDIFPVELGWAMNPGSPYRHRFNSQIRKQLESGLISKWLSDVINDPQRREGKDEAALPSSSSLIQALGLHHLQGVFFILSIGYITSLLTFLFELTVGKRSPNN
ncbi:LOW QUALITY PROTEIN: glutamate receptor U1-like [Palaemon carinicauda]|uniref:LOW QUALITY PROTEIN: glutamate receptor U1-like n=1 Tax=Palaemon carinicauda TaxID=392227 RepID=UPI0035B6A869